MSTTEASGPRPRTEVLLKGLAGLAGYAVGGPSGALIGAVGGDLFTQALKLDAEQIKRKVRRIETVIEGGAASAGTDWESFDSKLQSHPASSELYWRVLDVAGGAVSHDKLTGLSRILASVVIDCAKLDLAFILSNALQEMEAPHIRALALINGGHDGEWFDVPRWRQNMDSNGSALPDWAPVWDLDGPNLNQWMAHECGGVEVFPAILFTLRRHGLITNMVHTRVKSSITSEEVVVVPTSLGRTLLTMIHQTAPPWVAEQDIERRQQLWLDSDLTNNLFEFEYEKQYWHRWKSKLGGSRSQS
jgi:hypothetical protein